MSIHTRIKKIRIESGLNQEDFAASIGLKRGNYAQIELGKQLPTIETVSRIVRIYNKTYEWVLEGKENASTPHNKRPEDHINTPEKDNFVSPTHGKTVSPTVSPTREIELLEGQIKALKGQLSDKEKVIKLLEEQKQEQVKKISAGDETLVSNIPVQPQKEKRGRIGKA